MQSFKFFGFKSVVLNGHLFHTCNISIDRIDAHPIIDGVYICNSDKLLKSGRVKETTTFTYLTTDIFEHTRMLKEIGIFLEQHAQNKLKKKYAWAHQQAYAEVPEYEMDFGYQMDA
jgi:hypothetical protein